MNSALAATIGLILSIILIIKKVSPVYSLILGALTGGLLAGWGLENTVTEMISGIKDITPAIIRILAAGVLTGMLVKTGGDDHGVGIASYRQHLEEIAAFLDAGDLEDRNIVAFGMQHRVEAFDHGRREPQANMVAHEQRDAHGTAGLECGRRARCGEIELLGDAQHLLSCGRRHQLGSCE